jgi:hypothetical protein
VDRCDLCGAGSDGTFSDRTRHLRKEHPAYARGLLLRIVAPMVFLVALVALQASGAPPWTALVAAGASAVLAGLGIVSTRAARVEAGGPAGASIGRLFREGGYRFALVAGLFLAFIVLASTR